MISDYTIQEDGSAVVGQNELLVLSVDKGSRDGLDEAKVFMRHALKTNGDARTTLVGDLDGVRCYIREYNGKIHIMLTRRDLYE